MQSANNDRLLTASRTRYMNDKMTKIYGCSTAHPTTRTHITKNPILKASENKDKKDIWNNNVITFDMIKTDNTGNKLFDKVDEYIKNSLN